MENRSGSVSTPADAIITARKLHRGFTLIELLVVVGIIVLLISILIPSMWWAREYSRRAVCMANHKQLVSAALQYSTDHQGQLITASTPRTAIDNPGWTTTDSPGTTGIPTMGWVVAGNDSFSITAGLLYPYLNGGVAPTQTQAQVDATGAAPKLLKTYLCPNDLVTTHNRTYSINGYLNDPASTLSINFLPGGKTLNRWSQIKNPSSIIYFIDEYDSRAINGVVYNENGFTENCNSGLTQTLYDTWMDVPGIFHLDGNNLSFADGHAEWWKWQDARTLQLTPASGNTGLVQSNNADLYKLENYLVTGTAN